MTWFVAVGLMLSFICGVFAYFTAKNDYLPLKVLFMYSTFGFMLIMLQLSWQFADDNAAGTEVLTLLETSYVYASYIYGIMLAVLLIIVCWKSYIYLTYLFSGDKKEVGQMDRLEPL